MGYGSGTLFQRGKKGTWYYQAWVEGRQVGPFSAKTTDRQKAIRELDKLLGRRARGELTRKRGDDLKAGDLLDDYIEHAKRDLEPNTAYVYEKTIEAHLRKPFGSLRVSAIDTNLLKKYRVQREKDGWDPVTVNRELSYLRGAMRRAMKEGTIQSVPYFPMVKENNARKVFQDEPD